MALDPKVAHVVGTMLAKKAAIQNVTVERVPMEKEAILPALAPLAMKALPWVAMYAAPYAIDWVANKFGGGGGQAQAPQGQGQGQSFRDDLQRSLSRPIR